MNSVVDRTSAEGLPRTSTGASSLREADGLASDHAEVAQEPSHLDLLIAPTSGWRAVNCREIWVFRELLWFLIWRDLKVRYRQTAMGILWAILQPLAMMVVFTVVFNRLGQIDSDGPPYPLFAFVGFSWIENQCSLTLILDTTSPV